MQATLGMNRVSERAIGTMLAILASLAVGGAGGYVVKSLASPASLSVTAPARVAPAFQSSGSDAVDRALARTTASPIGHEDSHFTISQDRSPLQTRADRQLN